MVKRISIKEGLDKVGQKGYDSNQDNVINSDDIQTSEVVDTREVYHKVKHAMVQREEVGPLQRRAKIIN